MSRPPLPMTTPSSTAGVHTHRESAGDDWGRKARAGRTFVVDDDASRDLDLAVGAEGVRAGGLEEEEGLCRGGVVELLDVCGVVAANGDALRARERGRGWCERGRRRRGGRGARQAARAGGGYAHLLALGGELRCDRRHLCRGRRGGGPRERLARRRATDEAASLSLYTACCQSRPLTSTVSTAATPTPSYSTRRARRTRPPPPRPPRPLVEALQPVVDQHETISDRQIVNFNPLLVLSPGTHRSAHCRLRDLIPTLAPHLAMVRLEYTQSDPYVHAQGLDSTYLLSLKVFFFAEVQGSDLVDLDPALWPPIAAPLDLVHACDHHARHHYVFGWSMPCFVEYETERLNVLDELHRRVLLDSPFSTSRRSCTRSRACHATTARCSASRCSQYTSCTRTARACSAARSPSPSSPLSPRQASARRRSQDGYRQRHRSMHGGIGRPAVRAGRAGRAG